MRAPKAKKSKILKHKAELANLIKANWERKEYSEHPQGYYYWTGTFYSEDGVHIYIYFQNYVRRRNRGRVDYVKLKFNGCDGRALYPNEVKELLNQMKDEKG